MGNKKAIYKISKVKSKNHKTMNNNLNYNSFNELKTSTKELMRTNSSHINPWRSLALCSSKEARYEVPYELAKTLTVLPLSIHEINGEEELFIAVSNSEDIEKVKSNLKLITSKRCIIQKTDSELIKKAILIAYKSQEAIDTFHEISKSEPDYISAIYKKRISIDISETKEEKIPKILKALLTLAYKENASDIHLESNENNTTKVVFRLNGLLENQTHIRLTNEIYLSLIQHIKVISGLDITEHFAPLDGMFEFNANERKIRVRISIIPSVHGVKLAMRLLYHPLLDEIDASSKKPIENLGLNENQKNIFLSKLRKKGGTYFTIWTYW